MRKPVYVLKGYVNLKQERFIGLPWGGGDLALLLLLVRPDAETGKILMVDHREREWKNDYHPSVEEFDEDWANGVKEGDYASWMLWRANSSRCALSGKTAIFQVKLYMEMSPAPSPFF